MKSINYQSSVQHVWIAVEEPTGATITYPISWYVNHTLKALLKYALRALL